MPKVIYKKEIGLNVLGLPEYTILPKPNCVCYNCKSMVESLINK